MGVPTFMIFRDGKVVAKGVGAKSEKQLREMIKSTL
jgi:thioredoxin-like negative regulator of GroEL